MPDATTDLAGPHKEKPLRVWVETKKLVVFRTRIEKSKDYDLMGKPIKKATVEDCNKAFAQIQQGHDEIGGTSSGVNLPELGAFAAKASS